MSPFDLFIRFLYYLNMQRVGKKIFKTKKKINSIKYKKSISRFRFSIDNFFVGIQLLQVKSLGRADFYSAMLETLLKPKRIFF